MQQSNVFQMHLIEGPQEQEAKQSEKEQIESIFEHWKAIAGHKRARLDTKRRDIIRARLKDGYSVEDLHEAIQGCYLSPWHQGDNPSGRKCDDIGLICRDAEHIDKFLALYELGKGALERERAKQKSPPVADAPADPSKVRQTLDSIRRMMGR